MGCQPNIAVADSDTFDAIKRNMKLVPSSLCGNEVLFQVTGQCDPSIGLAYLAERFPTSYSFTLKEAGDREPDYRSKSYWQRVLNGTRPIEDRGLIERIHHLYPNATELLNCVLWKVLSNPLATNKELNNLLIQLHPYLEGVFYEVPNNDEKICYKRLYWVYKNYDVINSLHALAFKLILMRKTHFEAVDFRWKYDLTSTTLLLLRCISSDLI